MIFFSIVQKDMDSNKSAKNSIQNFTQIGKERKRVVSVENADNLEKVSLITR